MAKKSSLSTHSLALYVLWVCSIAVVGLLVAYLIGASIFTSKADTTTSTTPSDTITVAAGQTQTINGVGSLRVRCDTSSTTPTASFSASVTLQSGARGGVTNSSNTKNGTSLALTSLNKNGIQYASTLSPGKSSGYLYPGTLSNGEGSFSVSYPATTVSTKTFSNCDVLIKGAGNTKVTANGKSPLTVDVYYLDATTPVATADDPIPLETTITTEQCLNNITVKSPGSSPTKNAPNQVVDGVITPPTTQTGTINGYNTYNVSVTDSQTGAVKELRIDKNKDSKLTVTKNCDGSLTVVQPPKPAGTQ